MKVLSKKDISEFYAKCEREDEAVNSCADLPGKPIWCELDQALNELQDEVA